MELGDTIINGDLNAEVIYANNMIVFCKLFDIKTTGVKLKVTIPQGYVGLLSSDMRGGDTVGGGIQYYKVSGSYGNYNKYNAKYRFSLYRCTPSGRRKCYWNGSGFVTSDVTNDVVLTQNIKLSVNDTYGYNPYIMPGDVTFEITSTSAASSPSAYGSTQVVIVGKIYLLEHNGSYQTAV